MKKFNYSLLWFLPILLFSLFTNFKFFLILCGIFVTIMLVVILYEPIRDIISSINWKSITDNLFYITLIICGLILIIYGNIESLGITTFGLIIAFIGILFFLRKENK